LIPPLERPVPWPLSKELLLLIEVEKIGRPIAAASYNIPYVTKSVTCDYGLKLTP
jgi:hypothetical protein